MTRPESFAIDTSVAIPMALMNHDAHSHVRHWAMNKTLHLSGYALAETYSVLTRLPGDARVNPVDACSLINALFNKPITLSEQVQQTAHLELCSAHISGGAVYDGLVALAARSHGLTLATRDARARSTYEALGVPVIILL